MPVTEDTRIYECKAVAASVALARDVVHTHTHICAQPSPLHFSLGLPGFPSRTALAKRRRPAAATARTICSRSSSEPRSPMLLTAAVYAEREKEEQSGLLARAVVKKTTDQQTTPQRKEREHSRPTLCCLPSCRVLSGQTFPGASRRAGCSRKRERSVRAEWEWMTAAASPDRTRFVPSPILPVFSL